MTQIREGERLKWGHGFCWHNYDRNTDTTALVPFNFILRWLRQLYMYLSSPYRSKVEQSIRDKMHEKYSQGYTHGEENARRYTIKEVGKSLGEGMGGLESLIDKWVKEGYYFDRPE